VQAVYNFTGVTDIKHVYTVFYEKLRGKENPEAPYGNPDRGDSPVVFV
jgi:hypothetical protein